MGEPEARVFDWNLSLWKEKQDYGRNMFFAPTIYITNILSDEKKQ